MNSARPRNLPLALAVAAVEGLMAAAFALAPHGSWPVDGARFEAAGRTCDQRRFSAPLAGPRER